MGMSSRRKDKHWEKDDDQYRLWGKLSAYEQKERCLAILKETKDKKWVWTVMDFEDMSEPSELSVYNAEGFEKFDYLLDAQLRVEECIENRIDDLICNLEEIKELFEL